MDSFLKVFIIHIFTIIGYRILMSNYIDINKYYNYIRYNNRYHIDKIITSINQWFYYVWTQNTLLRT